MELAFPNKTVIVTGAAHGFGRAIALAFAQRGARVWACDVLTAELVETQQICSVAGGQCEVRTVDVTDQAAVAGFVTDAATGAGQIDVLVNNAGGVLGQVGRPLEEISPSDWQAIF